MLVGKITKTLGQETKFIRNVLIKNNDEFAKNATKPLKNTFKKEKQHVRQSQGSDDSDEESSMFSPCSGKNNFSNNYSSKSKNSESESRVNSIITYFKIYEEMENYEDFKELVNDLTKRDLILEQMYQTSLHSNSHLLNQHNIQPLVIPISLYVDYFKMNTKWSIGKENKLLYEDMKRPNILPISVNETFYKHFNLYSDSMFTELSWDNICVMGDSVYNCLIGVENPTKYKGLKLANFYFNQTNSSIDFYLFGLNLVKAKEKIKYLILYITTFCKKNSCQFEILQSNSIISIISDNYRRINIICKPFLTFESLLYLYPIDCAKLLYDGEDIYCTPRTHLSLMCSINIYNWNFHSSSYIYELYYYAKKGYMIYLNKYTPKLKEKFEENNQLDKLFYLDKIKDNTDLIKKNYLGIEDLCLSDSLLFNHEIPWGVAVTAKNVVEYLNEIYKDNSYSDGCENDYDFINNGEDLAKFMNTMNWGGYEMFSADCDPKTVFARRRLSSQIFC